MFRLFFLCCAAVYSMTVRGQGASLPYLFNCDTLFWTAPHSTLDEFLENVMEKVGKSVKAGKKGEAALMTAVAGEGYAAIGCPIVARNLLETSIELFQDESLTKEERSELEYYHALAQMRLAEVLTSLGSPSEKVLNEIQKGIDLFTRWMPSSVKHFNEEDNDVKLKYVGILLSNADAATNLHVRNYAAAIDGFQESLHLLEDLFGERTPNTMEYGIVQEMMADVYYRIQDYNSAISCLHRSMKSFDQATGRQTTTYAIALFRLADIYYHLNDMDEAWELLSQSNAIYERLGYQYVSDFYANNLLLMGNICLNLNAAETAAKCYDMAYEIQRQLCGEDNSLTLTSKMLTSYPKLMQSDVEGAWVIANEVMENDAYWSNLASDNFTAGLRIVSDIALTAGDLEQMLSIEDSFLSWVQTAGGEQNLTPTMVRDIYLNIGRAYQRLNRIPEARQRYAHVLELQRRMVHDNFAFLKERQRADYWQLNASRMNSIFTLNQAPESASAEGVGSMLFDAALLQKGLLLSASVNLARVVEESGDMDLQQKLVRMHLLQQSQVSGESKNELKALEEEVVQAARRYGDFMDYVDLTWRDVQRGLTPNDVAVEFLTSHLSNGSVAYSAEVLRSDMKEVCHIPLFTLRPDELDKLHCEPGTYTAFVRQNLWTPQLRALLHEGDHVWFSPAGELYNIGVEYMPLPDGGRMDLTYRMHRLSSTRELAQRRVGYASDVASPLTKGVLFGGLNYNTSLADMELYAANIDTHGMSRGVGSGRGISGSGKAKALWPNLPGTKTEVQGIAATMKATGVEATLYQGSEGVEEAFKALNAQGEQVIHIATHGFYLPGNEDALKRTGLVFAGANNFWKEFDASSLHISEQLDDGLLLAHEVATMNLIGARLVVLSACQTALGEVTGEGVFGLQRAFKKAGVQSLLMSLWEVDDDATQLMMKAFYRAYMGGATPADALRKAQEAVRKETFMRDGKECPGSDPYFWASFVLMD